MPKSSNKRKNGTVAEKKPVVTTGPLRVSARGQAQAAAQQVAALAEDFSMLVQGTQTGFTEVNDKVRKIDVILGATIDVLGIREQVEAKIKADTVAAQQKAADQAREGLEKLIAEGIMVATPEITDETIIVGFETDTKTGDVIPPGRIQVQVGGERGLRDEIKSQILGKGLGAQIALAEENKTLTVTEVYRIDTERLAAFQAERVAKAQQAANDNVEQPAPTTSAAE